MEVKIVKEHLQWYGLPDIVYNVDEKTDYHGFHRILDGPWADWNILATHIIKEPTPYFQHDCKQCTYLASIVFANNEKFDLYHCAADAGFGATTIARFGKDGDYMSGIEFGRRFFENPERAKTPAWQAHGIAYYIAKCLGLEIEEKFRLIEESDK